MAEITLKGNKIHSIGDLPAKGSQLPDFKLTGADLADKSNADFAGKRMVLNIFPSLDTSTCAASVRHFNSDAEKLPDTVVLCISADLPFAHKRFCETEGLKNVVTLSTFRYDEFGSDFGVKLTSGPLAGLMSRAVVITDQKGKVIYTEQVPEISHEPDYEAALASLK